MEAAVVNINLNSELIDDFNKSNQTGYGKVISMDSNNQLIEDCKNGVKSSYEKIYCLYVKAMFNISLRITNDKEESEDVLQESFVKAFQNINQFEGKSTFGSWLKRIVINKSIDIVRKRKIKFISFEDVGHLDYSEEDSINENESEYSVESINKAVQLLPDGFRTVLTLYLFEDYSHKEIGEMLGISESTSKTQYLRGKKKLIVLLNQSQLA